MRIWIVKRIARLEDEGEGRNVNEEGRKILKCGKYVEWERGGTEKMDTVGHGMQGDSVMLIQLCSSIIN